MNIMTLALQALMTAAIIAVVLNSKPYIWVTELLKLPAEPFRCALCTGFWAGLGFYLLQGEGFWTAVWAAGAVSFTAELLDRKLNE